MAADSDLYPILSRALAAADPSERPEPPYHAGGPMPKLSALAALDIAIWSAEHVAALAPAAQKAEIQRVLALAHDVAREPPARPKMAYTEPRFRALTTQLEEAARTRSKDSRSLGAARRTAGGAASLCKGKPDMVWPNAAYAAERAVQALREKGDRVAVRAYLAALDDRILAAELELIDADVKIARVLWRGSNEKGLPGLWLVKLANGTYGLRRKLGSRFTWLTGSRDDVVASVPDVDFERAVSIAMAREPAG
jgi:hypothetical protein